ncbi:LysR family transcriptional regulator [Vibrio sp. T187]|uniref:LysR family transcriptional regulator n=1 Tax=Vibrio TaxID=662 RepID=UPI0010C9EC75|nr:MULTISPECIES: LysR family transcriptional regulator [Vibrio]MBW3696849.1 LysR family transcriptional regulator [Vibrio sp. T187]
MQHLDAIPYFLAVVKHSSFAGAARELGVSRSAVNKRVIQLESSLGVRLLHRTTRQVSLTEPGEQFNEHLTKANYWLTKAEDAATSQQNEAIGTLRVNAPMSFGRIVLAPLIPQFLKRYPHIHVDMTMDDSYVDIVQGGYDVAIRAGDLNDSSLVAKRLASVRSIVCASPDYFKDNQLPMPTTPFDLASYNALLYRHMSESSEWFFAKHDQLSSVVVKGNYRVNNSEALLTATVAGAGVARLPDFVANEPIRLGKLISLLDDYQMPEKNVYALFPKREQMPLKLRLFIDFLAQSLNAESGNE